MVTRFLTYAELRAEGFSRRQIRAALEVGYLVRARRDRYVHADAGASFIRAASLGARLDCISLLAELGVFVAARSDGLHVQLTRGSSRTPLPSDVVRHWRLTSSVRGDLGTDLVEALAQAVRCQRPREAIATLDSAWHAGLVDEANIAAVFRRLPARFGVLRSHLDPRAESGPETIMRLLLRALGCSVEVQVVLPGVGRVDLIVDGWLVIECDSRAHHSGVGQQVTDRRRDLAAAALGFTTLRVLAEDILYRPEDVVTAIRGLRRAHADAHPDTTQPHRVARRRDEPYSRRRAQKD